MDLLLLAAKIAEPQSNDLRRFWVGAIGKRKDGKAVFSKNGAVHTTAYDMKRYQYIPISHAECRVIRKMDCGGVLYVARVAREDRSLKMSRPCSMCQNKIKSRGIKKVFYTINNTQYGVWYVDKNEDVIFNFGNAKKF